MPTPFISILYAAFALITVLVAETLLFIVVTVVFGGPLRNGQESLSVPFRLFNFISCHEIAVRFQIPTFTAVQFLLFILIVIVVVLAR